MENRTKYFSAELVSQYFEFFRKKKTIQNLWGNIALMLILVRALRELQV